MGAWGDTIEVSEAETRFRELLEAIKRGAEITLVEGEEAVARLVPPAEVTARTPGLHPGAMQASDDFDEPLEISSPH